MPNDTVAPKARRRALNISVRADLIEIAKSLDLNTSQAAEAGIAAAVKRAQEEAWVEQNQAAIKAHNERIDEQGPSLKPSWLSD